MSDLQIINKVFPITLSETKMQQLQYDVEGLWSITHPDDADKITNIIISFLENKSKNINHTYLTITDATSGLGGNTISFAQKFKKVNSVEYDTNRFKMLSNNIKLYNLKNIMLINLDYTKIVKTISQDIVFLDPPWGGPNYKFQDKVIIKLGSLSMDMIIENLEGRCKIVCIKLPTNFNIDELVEKVSYPIYLYYIKKMIIIIVDMM